MEKKLAVIVILLIIGSCGTVACENSYQSFKPPLTHSKTDVSSSYQAEEEWNKTFGGISDDEGYAMQQTMDHGYIITGTTSSYGSGMTDVWLLKTDHEGNELWNHTFGGSDYENGYSVDQTDDGDP